MNDHSGWTCAHLGLEVTRERCSLMLSSEELINLQFMRISGQVKTFSPIPLRHPPDMTLRT